mmetsp:Transcript_17451/g.25787  ORF Transcript_17451/g.25787 Transcript_17451/m.25787 type:complete len:197 (-) Transcript_17451:90-680(-)|eukprot:CAMPEP_0194213874 /NCGR_PEP_ID=MMETSP0156-20130528/14757_1 /TAXON_ID=33649 /ORGANISM="Thalassionema nitzschioides, Strain L26-B" /LENGTH=196 /DNA_ID=CAMNT_0038942007 /DNA_START=84 /DNA_END=674 /DNA_ORIENTATION=-
MNQINNSTANYSYGDVENKNGERSRDNTNDKYHETTATITTTTARTNENDESNEINEQKRKTERAILILFLVYLALVGSMFLGPRLIVDLSTSSDGWANLSNVLFLLLVLFVAEVIVAVTSLVLTARNWSRRISTISKCMGLFPIVGTVAIVVIVIILSDLGKGGQEDNDVSILERPPCNFTNGTKDDCFTSQPID